MALFCIVYVNENLNEKAVFMQQGDERGQPGYAMAMKIEQWRIEESTPSLCITFSEDDL